VLEHLLDIEASIDELNIILAENGQQVKRVPLFSRGFTHWDHKSRFEISFPLYFQKDINGGYDEIEFIFIKK